MELWHWAVLALAFGYLALSWAVRNWAAAQATARKPVSIEQAFADLETSVGATMLVIGEELMPLLEDAIATATDLLREYERQRRDG